MAQPEPDARADPILNLQYAYWWILGGILGYWWDTGRAAQTRAGTLTLGVPGRYLSHTELAPLRAPLIPMEHCTTRFFEACDLDNDKYIALEEWASCFGIKEREYLPARAGDTQKFPPQGCSNGPGWWGAGEGDAGVTPAAPVP